MGRRARAAAAPTGPGDAVDRILADPRVAWLGVKHHSPACAWHVDAWIREHRPAAVLIEAPEDANDVLPWLAHAETAAPLALLFAFTDKAVETGRVRWMWPILAHDPEWVALRTGSELGIDVRLIDAPARAIHAAGGARPTRDRELGPEDYLEAAALRAGRPNFDALWESAFEHAPDERQSVAFFRAVLTLGWCARASGGEVDPATALREGHMRWCVDQALAAHPTGRIAVVTGAFHAAALIDAKAKRVKPRADAGAGVVLTAPSHRALSRRGVDHPGWGAARWSALHGGPDPALYTLVAVTAEVRAAGVPVGTADAVGAVEVARGLAALRSTRAAGAGITVSDVVDGARSALVKGAIGGPAVDAAVTRVLIGEARGRLPAHAGRPPLVEDFWAEVARHRLTLDDEVREVRCTVADNPRHQAKSAFLHRCRLLEVPMFAPLPDGRDDAVFRGPNWADGTDLHLIVERWGVTADPAIDDRLLELSERGGTVVEAATDALGEAKAAAGDDVAARAGILLHAAQMRLTELLPKLLDDLAAAVARDPSLANLVRALLDLALLQNYRGSLPTHGHARVSEVLSTTYDRACLALASVRFVADPEVPAMVDALVSLTRFAVLGGGSPDGGPDRELLASRMAAAGEDRATHPSIRGTLHGLLAGLGAMRVEAIAVELRGYLRGVVEEVRRGGAYLEGVLGASRTSFLRSGVLLAAVHDVVVRLPDDAFAAVLPDLRRAFAVFVPAEIERIGERVAGLVGLRERQVETFGSPGWAAIVGPLDRAAADRLAVIGIAGKNPGESK